MTTSTTRLTLTNENNGMLNATYELTLSNGESMRLNFHLPKKTPSQTVEEIEEAMLQRALTLADHILKA